MNKDRVWTEHGFQLDGASFSSHASDCERCRQFDKDKPATAALCCLDGSILLKQDAARDAPKRSRATRSDTYASKAEVKAVMRYK